MTDAEQQVGGTIRYKDADLDENPIEEHNYPETPLGLENANLSGSFSNSGYSVSASLISDLTSVEDQITAEGSAFAFAVWYNDNPEEWWDVHGGAGSTLTLYLTRNLAPVYFNVSGQFDMTIDNEPTLHPEESFAYVKLSSDDGTFITEEWKVQEDCSNGNITVPFAQGLWLVPDKIYILEAHSRAGTVAMPENPYFKSRTASFSLTATIESTFEITGPEWTILYNLKNPKQRLQESPSVQLEATGGPSGGEYLWEIVTGQDKAEIVGANNERQIELRGTSPSVNVDDVMVKATYTVDSQVYEDTHIVIVRKPTTLIEYKRPKTRKFRDIFQFYETTYYYTIHDQWGQRMAAAPHEPHVPPIPFQERLKLRDKWPKWFPIGSLKETEAYGETSRTIEDSLIPPRYMPLPKDLRIRLKQELHVAGWLVSVRCITFYYDHAESVPGECSK